MDGSSVVVVIDVVVDAVDKVVENWSVPKNIKYFCMLIGF